MSGVATALERWVEALAQHGSPIRSLLLPGPDPEWVVQELESAGLGAIPDLLDWFAFAAGIDPTPPAGLRRQPLTLFYRTDPYSLSDALRTRRVLLEDMHPDLVSASWLPVIGSGGLEYVVATADPRRGCVLEVSYDDDSNIAFDGLSSLIEGQVSELESGALRVGRHGRLLRAGEPDPEPGWRPREKVRFKDGGTEIDALLFNVGRIERIATDETVLTRGVVVKGQPVGSVQWNHGRELAQVQAVVNALVAQGVPREVIEVGESRATGDEAHTIGLYTWYEP
jgi:hypothetical protein